MSGALREILASFGFELDEKGAKKAEATIQGLLGKVQTLGQGIAAAFAFHSFAGFIEGQIEAGSRVHDTAEKLGVAADELQRWAYAGKLAGVESDEMNHSLGFLNKNIGLAVTGGEEQSKAFASMGIATRDASGHVKSASDVALEMADKLGAMGSQAERTAAITKVMGRAGGQLLPLFSDGAKGIKEAFGEFDRLGGAMSGEFLDAADKAGDQIDRMKFAFEGLKHRITLAVLPTLTKVTTWLTETIALFHKWIANTNGIAVALRLLVAGGILTGLIKIGKALGLGSMSAKDMLITMLKWGPIVLLVAALFLAIEDLYTLMTGGDSLIGQLLGDEKSAQLVKDLKQSFDEIQKTVIAMLPDLKEMGSLLLKAFVDALPQLVSFFSAFLKDIVMTMKLLGGAVDAMDALGKGDWGGAGKAIDKAGDSVFGKGGVWEGVLDGITGGSKFLGDTDAYANGAYTPTAHVTYGPVSVTVQGGMTNAETGKAVAGAVSDAQKGKRQTLAAVKTTAPEGT